MTATVQQLRVVTEPFTVLQPTQRWRIIEGRHYRETVVRTASGQLRLVGIPEAA